MKKTIITKVVLFAAALAMTASVAAASDTGSSAEAAADASAVAEAPLSAGCISVDGDIFVMGTKFSDLPADTWTLNPEDYEKFKVYSINPRTTMGNAMSLYKDAYGREFSCFHVMVSLMNLSEEPIAYFDGAIDYLNIPGIARAESVAPVVFPGGLTLESTEEDFIAAYGDPVYKYDDESTDYKSRKFEDGEVQLEIVWSKGVISDITMTI